MALSSRGSLVLIILLSVLFAFSRFNVSTAFSNRKTASTINGFHVLDPKDPKVVDVGKFAVHLYNKQSNNKLKFKKVFKAASQEIAATKTEYALIIGAREHHILNKFGAVVLEKKNSSRVLIGFKKIWNV